MSDQNKYELIEKLVLIEDESVLQQIKAILDTAESPSLNELNPKLRDSIKTGVEQSDLGLGTSHDEVMKETRSRFRK